MSQDVFIIHEKSGNANLLILRSLVYKWELSLLCVTQQMNIDKKSKQKGICLSKYLGWFIFFVWPHAFIYLNYGIENAVLTNKADCASTGCQVFQEVYRSDDVQYLLHAVFYVVFVYVFLSPSVCPSFWPSFSVCRNLKLMATFGS